MATKGNGPTDLDDAAFKAEVSAAKRPGERLASREARAIDAYFDADTGEVCVRLSRGARLFVPHELIEGLAGASIEELADVEIMPAGTGLRWPTLDIDVSVPGLAMEIFGSKAWMRELARRAGSTTGAAKAAAARANGRKGGRPKTAA